MFMSNCRKNYEYNFEFEHEHDILGNSLLPKDDC